MNAFIQLLKTAIELLFSVTGDYGVSIVLITVLIRCLLVPLDLSQRRQMEKQKEIGQRVEQIKNQYKNNPKKAESELQKVYQESGTGLGSCLILLLQIPVMYGLYNAIRLISTAACATVLLPWVSSLLVRDRMLIMPIATLMVQVLPQLFPYISWFRSLELQKQPIRSVAAMLAVNSLYLFMIPAGVGLYCFASGLFQTAEQLICNVIAVQRKKNLAAGNT